MDSRLAGTRFAGTACALSLLLAGAAGAQPSYLLHGIGHLPMAKEPADVDASFAHDVNDAGVVAGQSTASVGSPPELAAGELRALRFSASAGLEALGDLPDGGETSAALAVNGAGDLAGRGDTWRDPNGLPPDLSDAVHAAHWSDPDAVEDLGPGTGFSEARALSDPGRAAGATGASGERRAFFHTSGLGLSLLPDPPGAIQTTAEDLNASDTIVGHAHTQAGQVALRWNGIATPLVLGDLDGDGGDSAAFGINDAGWIVGSSDDDGEQRAFRRDPVSGALEGLAHLPGGDFSRARDIDAAGRVVGTAWHPASQGFRAVLWEADGTVHDLNELLANGAGWVLEEALAISDTGFIAGTGRNPAGELEGFVLPEPGRSASLAAALALLAGLARGKTR